MDNQAVRIVGSSDNQVCTVAMVRIQEWTFVCFFRGLIVNEAVFRGSRGISKFLEWFVCNRVFNGVLYAQLGMCKSVFMSLKLS